jgi:hypothetical protein
MFSSDDLLQFSIFQFWKSGFNIAVKQNNAFSPQNRDHYRKNAARIPKQ